MREVQRRARWHEWHLQTSVSRSLHPAFILPGGKPSPVEPSESLPPDSKPGHALGLSFP